MGVTFSWHARERLEQRGINQAVVIAAVRRQMATVKRMPSHNETRIHCGKVTVVARASDVGAHVVTVWDINCGYGR